MERVQFQQEQMLSELKDLVQKGLFTQKEIKKMMQKRTSFETALIRRIPKKSDFLRYATYEMTLEALRRKRAERLKTTKGPPSVSDYALVRRQFQIFERALKKFKADVGLWIQYIQVAKKEGARSLVGRITARALQLHPNVPALYVLAASHELEHLSSAAARALLQRGLRLNAGSVEMWREYVRMEMGFVESLRRRWSVLGIDANGRGKESGVQKDKNKESDGGVDDVWRGLGDEADNEPVTSMDVDEEERLEEDEAARREIMEGAIVKSAISSAVKALPTIELFSSLHNLISSYPSPPVLRETLLEHLHAELRTTLPCLPAAIKLTATRHLTPELAGEPLVDALKSANEELLETVRSAVGNTQPDLVSVYVEFVEEWCRKIMNDSLKAYLITSVHLLIQQLAVPVPAVLYAAHIRILVSHQPSLGPGLLPSKVNTPEKILRAARRHTNKAPSNAAVWLARLDAERRFAEPETVTAAWAEARKSVKGDDVDKVWLWGLELPNRRPPPSNSNSGPDSDIPSGLTLTDSETDVQLLEHLLYDSQLIHEPAVAGALHEALLIRYAAASRHALLRDRSQMAIAHPASTSPTIALARSPSRTSQPSRGSPSPHTTATTTTTKTSGVAHTHHALPASGSTDSRATRTTTRTIVTPDADADAILQARLERVRRISSAYMPTARVWRILFEQESESPSSLASPPPSGADDACAGARPGPGRGGCLAHADADLDLDGDARVLRSVYEFWREKDGVEATTAWAAWLLRHGRTKEAVAVVGRARRVLGEMAGEAVERRWKAVLDRDVEASAEDNARVGADVGAGPDEE